LNCKQCSKSCDCATSSNQYNDAIANTWEAQNYSYEELFETCEYVDSCQHNWFNNKKMMTCLSSTLTFVVCKTYRRTKHLFSRF